jgi:hypothetical protein
VTTSELFENPNWRRRRAFKLITTGSDIIERLRISELRAFKTVGAIT